MQSNSVAHTLTGPQKRLIHELLQIGRWNDESEIIRYGLHLVAREVDAEQSRQMEPYPTGVLARAYRKLDSRERQEEKAMAQASAYPGGGELE